MFDAVRHAVAKCPKLIADPSCPATNLYEVLYIGKVVVSTKKAPPSFIDDAVAKFDEVSRQVENTLSHTHTHTHPFNGSFSGTTQVSWYQKGKTSLDFTEARDSEWQWHQLGHMQVCMLLQTGNHASTPLLSFFTGRMPFLPPNQQRQSTEGKSTEGKLKIC